MRYLEIEEVCFEDAGLYRITLENEYGRIESTARLDIIKSNKVNRRGIRASSAPNRDSRSISRRIMGYSTRIGGRMALAGQRASSIPAKKTVYHDGYDITDSERLTITENENEFLIEIANVKTYDEGEYTLMLEDEDGVITTTTTFAKVHYVDDETFGEKIPPKIKQHLSQNVTSIEGSPLDLTIHLDCKIPFDYVWFKNDEPIINSDDFM
jgi:myosin-light-chain kinase